MRLNTLRFGYKGMLYDETTGLYNARARWYDPEVGRFISEDPIGLAGGINQYAFAGTDPINLGDPSGMDANPVCVTFSTGVSACSDWGPLTPVAITAGGPGNNSGYGSYVSDRGSGYGQGTSSESGGGGGGGGPGRPSQPTTKPKCSAQASETRVSGGVSALLGGGPVAGAFFGIGLSGGATSSGRIYLQVEGSLTVGLGIYGGYGYGVGLGHSSTTPGGLSTGSEYIGQANAGLFESAGATVTRDDAGNWGVGASPFIHVGNGFGAQVSGGRQGYTTLASPSFGFIRRFLGNNCQ